MSSEEQMNMVEILSEELGEKELKIMKLEEQLKEQSLLSTTKAVLSEYHEIGSNKYPNLLGCPRFD